MRETNIVIGVVLAAVLLAVLNLPQAVSGRAKGAVREGIAPLQRAVSGVGRFFRESFRSIRGIGDLVTENRKMAEELVLLRNEVRDLRSLERDNAGLREQLQFAVRSGRNLIPCEVIARDITGWWQTIRLGKGSYDGVAPDMAVITSEGLAGRTVDVSLRTCDVLLLSDPSCKVSAQIVRTGAFGIVAGKGVSGSGQVSCEMRFINKNAPVLPGDEVVTSGLGGVFPRGLLIGYVEKAEPDASGLYQRADILPKADLGAVSYVFVVSEQRNPVEEYLRRRDAGEEGEP